MAYSAEILSSDVKVERVSSTLAFHQGSKGENGAEQDLRKKSVDYVVKIRLQSDFVKKTQQINTIVYVVGEWDTKMGAKYFGARSLAVDKSPDKISVKKVIKSDTLPMETLNGKWTTLGDVHFNSHTTRTGLHDWTMGYNYVGLVADTYVDGVLSASKLVGGKNIRSTVDRYKANHTITPPKADLSASPQP